MSKIKIKIDKSNLNEFVPSQKYDIILKKCIGYGSYGYIFSTNYEKYVLKLLLDSADTFDLKYSDFNEVEVIDKIISSKNKFLVNCGDYAIGKIFKNIGEFLENDNIRIYVNREDSPLKIESQVKNEKFIIKEYFPVIIMPLFIPLNDSIYDCNFIKNNLYICKIMDLLIISQKEMLSIGLINLDLKTQNAVMDDNNNLKLIDFGIVKCIDKMEEIFNNSSKYYIWPFEKTSIEIVIPYMICIFIIEIYYYRIHDIKKNKYILDFIIKDFDECNNLSDDICSLLKKALYDGIKWDDFLEEFEKIKKEFNLDEVKLPIN